MLMTEVPEVLKKQFEIFERSFLRKKMMINMQSKVMTEIFYLFDLSINDLGNISMVCRPSHSMEKNDIIEGCFTEKVCTKEAFKEALLTSINTATSIVAEKNINKIISDLCNGIDEKLKNTYIPLNKVLKESNFVLFVDSVPLFVAKKNNDLISSIFQKRQKNDFHLIMIDFNKCLEQETDFYSPYQEIEEKIHEESSKNISLVCYPLFIENKKIELDLTYESAGIFKVSPNIAIDYIDNIGTHINDNCADLVDIFLETNQSAKMNFMGSLDNLIG